MNKAGQAYEQKIESSKNRENKQETFAKILERFKEIENSPDDSNNKDCISKRVKMLIKNMFTNKEGGWSMTQQINQGGPTTKAAVEKAMQDKKDKETAQRREDDKRGPRQSYNDNRGGDNRGNRDKNNRRDDRDK